ncbi:hypothetical protein Tco_1000163, partial [Tanacetum coccineum]
MEYLVNISKRRTFWSLNEDILKIKDSDYQYAVSIKEDTAYLCLHSPKTTKETSSIRRIQIRPIRRIEYIVCEDSGRYQTWSLLQETPIRHIQSLGHALAGSLTEEIYFDFRKQRFIYSHEKGTFYKLPYPTKETFSYYLSNIEYDTDAQIQNVVDKWGRNVLVRADSRVLMVYRNEKWTRVAGTYDIVSIDRYVRQDTETEESIRADMLFPEGCLI